VGIADHIPRSRRKSDEIVVTKTTDSALTGTNLRLILNNLGVSQVLCCGIFTDQCVSRRPCARWRMKALRSSWWRTRAPPDRTRLHRQELETINMIYCHAMSGEELLAYLP
jgi:nicotinamidase-related amidase